MKNVYLIPGFLASNLGVLPNGPLLWWDPTVVTALGVGKMRLAPDGVSPGPPDGVALGVDLNAQDPWPNIRAVLRQQLDAATWAVQVGNFDWRFDLTSAAASLSANIQAHSTPAEPATIVGHSAGGLVAVLAWANLVAAGQTNLVRRIISICTPFQGSYDPINWITGVNVSVQQLLAIGGLTGLPTNIAANLVILFLANLALTWPAFYELFPFYNGTEAAKDPNRRLLYQHTNYPSNLDVSSNWLAHSQTVFQNAIADPSAFPPDYVMTCVVSTGLRTPNKLLTPALPILLTAVGQTQDGDGTVTAGSQTRSPAQLVTLAGSHASVPLAITLSGLLAQLITDPRGPLAPPPPPINVPVALPVNVTDPPESDYVTGLQCLSGG